MAERAFQNVLRLAQQQQASVFNLFQKAARPIVSAPSSESAATFEESGTPTSVALTPVDVSGFYKVTGPTEVTFYVTTEWPNQPIGLGWTGDGFLGIRGQIQITGATNAPGPGYLWSFTLQTDTDQSIEGTQQSIGAFLYPPGLIQYTNKRTKVPLFGYYNVTGGQTVFYFTAPPPNNIAVDWIVTGLPSISTPMKVTSFSRDIVHEVYDPYEKKSINEKIYEKPKIVLQTIMTLEAIDGSVPADTTADVYVSGVPAMIQEPAFTTTFVPGKFTSFREAPKDLSQLPPVTMPSSISIGNYPEQRDLNSNTSWNAEPTLEFFPPGKYDESKGKGFSSGSILALEAIGPQEKYLLTDDLTKSQWNPEFKKYSNFVMYQKVYPFPPPSPFYQGQTVQIELRPTELGHLLSNMYLSVTLPANTPSQNVFNYTDHVGRALIKQIDLLVNETIVETLYDDWYILRDQMFLDADEQLGIYNAIGQTNLTSQTQQTITIPLEFFFCRRHSHNNRGRERLRRPYFPACAMWNQRLYVRFTFNPNTWWSNAPVGYNVDLYPPGTTLWPNLITEEILLENAEKLYYMNTPLKYIVNRVQKESPQFFQSQTIQLNFTANYPVQTLSWFFRNKAYETVTDGNYYNSRYSYGYTTQYIKTGVELQFPSGNANYVDVIDTAKITLNNVDILSTFRGSLYYSFKQPMEHLLSVPSKNIYMYSFGLSPKEYNQGGYLNFAKLNSQTTYLQITFLPQYTSQIIQGYNLYLYYYGYSLLQFQGGFASLPFV
jgi:Large eukaryotic DNA virus major capsid protein/Major capsid protein N-terminus